MEIKYIGHSSFYIRTKSARIVTDPFDPTMVGLKFPKIEADLVTVSHDHQDHNYIDGVKGEPLVLTWPGEFEKNLVRINGFKTFHDKKQGAERGENVMYKFEADGFSVLHCGDLGDMIDHEMIDAVGNVDVALMPVGGSYTVGPEEAVKILNEIEPCIVIPMHFNRKELNQTAYGSLSPLEAFLKEVGAEDREPQDKLVLKREEMDAEQMQIVVLNS